MKKKYPYNCFQCGVIIKSLMTSSSLKPYSHIIIISISSRFTVLEFLVYFSDVLEQVVAAVSCKLFSSCWSVMCTIAQAHSYICSKEVISFWRD